MEALALDIGRMDLTATLRCGGLLREVAEAATSLEDAAAAVARAMHETFIDPATGERSCALVRMFVTRPYAALDLRQRQAADAVRRDARPAAPDLKCLVLVGTAGKEPAWNSPGRSTGHQAIPLASEHMVREAPMIARLLEQFGLRVADVIFSRVALAPSLASRGFNVFHVEEALGSPYIPAQAEFVAAHGIASVIGFGGQLRSGELFAVIAFSRVRIPATSAERFRNVAISLRTALFALDAE